MDTSRPPHFDSTNFPYYKVIMACHLEVVDLGVWRVTRDGMKPIMNPDKLVFCRGDALKFCHGGNGHVCCMECIVPRIFMKAKDTLEASVGYGHGDIC